jgi:choline monooxygenase
VLHNACKRIDSNGAIYAFVYPNLMINRYGPVLDTNVVEPHPCGDPGRCCVTFDYYFENNLPTSFINDCLASSHQIQVEDMAICASVQRGMSSPGGYDGGRYVPSLEHAMRAFHLSLAEDMLGQQRNKVANEIRESLS